MKYFANDVYVFFIGCQIQCPSRGEKALTKSYQQWRRGIVPLSPVGLVQWNILQPQIQDKKRVIFLFSNRKKYFLQKNI